MKENSRGVLTHGIESNKPPCRVVTQETPPHLPHQIQRFDPQTFTIQNLSAFPQSNIKNQISSFINFPTFDLRL
jgi:hypothetical protein